MTEERLPMTSADSEASPATPAGARPPPVRVESSSVRLVGTLAIAGALAGLAIVLVFEWAEPRIEAWRAEVLAAAVTEVLAGAERYETVYLAPPGASVAESDTAALDRVYVGYDGVDEPVGVALVGAGAGFQDVIRVIFGYDPGARTVIGMRVLESKETPGLGDKIEKDSAFVREFTAVAIPLIGLKAGRESGADGEVIMITGATISSRAIVDIINARLDEVGEQVDELWRSSVLTERATGVPVSVVGGGS